MHSALVPRWTTHVNKMDNVFEFNQRPWSVRLSVCWSPVFIVCLRGAASYDCRCCCASSLLKCQGLFDAHLDHWSPSRWQSISPPTWRWSFFYFFYFFESPSIWLWFGLSRIVFEAIVSVHNIIFFWDFITLSSFDICGISLNMILITLWGGGFASLHEEYPPVITTTTNATCMSISLLQLAHGAITSVYLLLQDHSNKLWINYLWWLPIR